MEWQDGMELYGDQQFDVNNILGSENYDNIFVDGFPEEILPHTSNNNKDKKKKIYHRHTPQQILELENLFVDGFPEEILPSNSNNNKDKKKKTYLRHTPQQILELKNLFKICPHPDEQQRLDIGKKLGLESKQVKFWFQNRRTQMKSQTERKESLLLKHEYDKIKVENIAMKEAIKNPLCQNCGGPSMLGEITMELNRLRFETARLKDELSRVCEVAEKMSGKPISDLVAPISTLNSNSNLEQSKVKTVLNGPMSSPTPLRIGFNLDHGASSSSTRTTSINGAVSTESEKTMYMQVAMAAMNELLAMARTDSSLWSKALDKGKDLLNHDEYVNRFSGAVMGIKPLGFIADASRETGSVFITSLELMETMMIPRQWKELFPCMISKAATVEVLCSGTCGTRDGELQLMNAEFVFPSPFVPFRNGKLLRFCKKQSEAMWAVVDVSADLIRESSFSGSPIKWRRLPSGCIIQDISNGYSLVTWIEHWEYDESYVSQLYQPLMRSGMAFGALRWLSALKRECDCSAVFTSARIYPDDITVGITQEGRKSILKLIRRLSNNFCSGLRKFSGCLWKKLQVGGLAVDVCVMGRLSIDKPGEPSGVVLSASTSIWIPVPRQQLFDFLRNEKIRGKWDILANGGPMEVIARFSKSHDGSNCISLLCPPAAPARESNMLILQDSWSDLSGSFITYAPVDSSSMETVLKGGDSKYLALLPSGFAISDVPVHSNVVTLDSGNSNHGGASALTIGFQILITGDSSTKLSVDSINKINDLMFRTIKGITESLGIN